jgi:predicted protein tyrosine phosphatase
VRWLRSYTLLSNGIEHTYVPSLDILGYPLLPKHWEECRQCLQLVFDDYNARHEKKYNISKTNKDDQNLDISDDHYNYLNKNSTKNADTQGIRRTTHAKIFVHCEAGINRSGTIVAAAMIYFAKMPLLDVIRQLKQQRGTILTNTTFQEQLVEFAMQNESNRNVAEGVR